MDCKRRHPRFEKSLSQSVARENELIELSSREQSPVSPSVCRRRQPCLLAELSAGHIHKAVNCNDQKDFSARSVFGNANAFLASEKETYMKTIRNTVVCTVF